MLKIFYDGKCIVCYREIHYYKNLDKDNLLDPIDITHPEFDAQEYGLDNGQVNLNMHAQDEEGNVFVGVEAFHAIWQRIDKFKLISKLTNNKPTKSIMKIGYYIFANHIRKHLPKKECDVCKV